MKRTLHRQAARAVLLLGVCAAVAKKDGLFESRVALRLRLRAGADLLKDQAEETVLRALSSLPQAPPPRQPGH